MQHNILPTTNKIIASADSPLIHVGAVKQLHHKIITNGSPTLINNNNKIFHVFFVQNMFSLKKLSSNQNFFAIFSQIKKLLVLFK